MWLFSDFIMGKRGIGLRIFDSIREAGSNVANKVSEVVNFLEPSPDSGSAKGSNDTTHGESSVLMAENPTTVAQGAAIVNNIKDNTGSNSGEGASGVDHSYGSESNYQASNKESSYNTYCVG